MNSKQAKGRPAPRRRPTSFRARLMGWVNRVTPWFAVAVIVLVAVWLACPTYRSFLALSRSTDRQGVEWATPAMYLGALVGVVFLIVVAVRAVSPVRFRVPDGAVRVFATLALLLTAFTFPLLVLRGELIPVAALLVYYVRLRKSLVEILPPWCGGTWKPAKRRRRAAEDVVKRPPRTWDATSGTGPSTPRGGGSPVGRPRRKQSKKKRRR